ncbi:MAG: AI-2E family transporter [Pseudobutyrivibrio sp.]|nr:AI-2E family transporter [Pseudobutyrivibrio sp.]
MESKSNKEKIITHIKNIIGIFLKYLKYSVIDGIIIAVANYIFMLYMKMPWKIGISILMGITNLIPSVGPVAGAIVGGVVLAFYDIKQALWFLAFTAIFQTIDGLIIKPKLFGDSFGISGVWMLIAMIVGGGVFGVLGIIFVVPVVAIGKYLIKNVYLPYKHKDDSSQE